MSPKNRNKLLILRSALDKLDNKLIKLIKKRTLIINQVLKVKNNRSEIVDKKRISIILKNIKKKSKKNNIDVSLTNKIWKNMIWAYIDYERKNFKKK